MIRNVDTIFRSFLDDKLNFKKRPLKNSEVFICFKLIQI